MVVELAVGCVIESGAFIMPLLCTPGPQVTSSSYSPYSNYLIVPVLDFMDVMDLVLIAVMADADMVVIPSVIPYIEVPLSSQK